MKKTLFFVVVFFLINTVDAQINLSISDTSRQIICSSNPFTNITRLSFIVPCDDCKISIDMFDTDGMYVITLFDGKPKKGRIDIEWDGMNSLGKKVDNNMYECKIVAEGFTKSIKLIYTE